MSVLTTLPVILLGLLPFSLKKRSLGFVKTVCEGISLTQVGKNRTVHGT